jgi:hypothetical protein
MAAIARNAIGRHDFDLKIDVGFNSDALLGWRDGLIELLAPAELGSDSVGDPGRSVAGHDQPPPYPATSAQNATGVR